MPIDPTGTNPQAVPQPPQLKEVELACRNSACDSKKAFIVPIPGQPNQRIYRCTKCHRTWGLNVGGFIDI